MTTKYDLTQKTYAMFAKRAMEENRAEDPNFTWTIKAINKSSIKFNWSYIGKTEDFVLTVTEAGDEAYVVVKIPGCTADVFILVGDDRWSDAKSVEMGIYKAIKLAANTAKRVF